MGSNILSCYITLPSHSPYLVLPGLGRKKVKNIAGLWRGERRALSSCSCSVLIREKAVVVVVVVCLSALQQNITATAEIIIMTTLAALLLGAGRWR